MFQQNSLANISMVKKILVTKLPTFIMDTSDAICSLKYIKFTDDYKNCHPFKMDICSLYTDILIAEGHTILKYYLNAILMKIYQLFQHYIIIIQQMKQCIYFYSVIIFLSTSQYIDIYIIYIYILVHILASVIF